MNRKAFRQLLKTYLDESCTEEERRIVDQWYELLNNDNQRFAEGEMGEVENRLWQKIQSTTIHRLPVEPIVKPKPMRRFYAIAASLIGIALLAGGISFQHNRNTSKNAPLITARLNEGFLEEVNNSDTLRNITLEDKTAVTIYPGAKLAFPKHFAAGKREVYLDGDAFFTVSKNPNRPFYVYNNQIVTQVLGTSFGIHRNKGQVEVAVKTGKVAVYENKDEMSLNDIQQKSNGVIITPNQKVTYYQQERHFVTSIVDQPVPVPKESGPPVTETHFNYNDTPLSRVLNDLQNTYGLEIVLENEKIKNCLFTGDLTGQTLFNKLEGIGLVFNVSYEVKGTMILLKGGKDCN